jgi:hypothetical protein
MSVGSLDKLIGFLGRSDRELSGGNVKVYLDTNLIGSNRYQQPEEAEALSALEKRQDIEWRISQRVTNEAERHPDEEARARLKLEADRLAKVRVDHQVQRFQAQSDQYGGLSAFPLVDDAADRSIFESLVQIGLTRVDAQHLTNAIYERCDVFLTRDEHSILDFRKEICSLYKDITICKPTELMTRLVSASDG